MSLALCLLSVTMPALAAGEWNPPNLVKNPGFESVTATGAPEDWTGDPQVYSVVGEPVHSGTHALRYVNSDPNRYVLCSQPIALEAGKAYEVSVWVKTEGIAGPETGATICMEWYGADGKYLGGEYPSGVKGTTDWTQVKAVTGRVPAGARCSVSCYVREHMTGQAWWDDVEVRQWRQPPLETLLLDPSYRGQVRPGPRPVVVRAQLALADYNLQPGQVSLRVDLLRGADGSLVRTRRVVPREARADVSVSARGLAPGKYDLRVTLLRSSDAHEMGTQSWRLQVLDAQAATDRVSFVDEHNRLIREGKPFFPLGMYWGEINEQDLRVYADSPFNCLMPYSAPTREQMDLAQSLGLKVIYTVKDVYYGSAGCPAEVKSPADERPFIETRVKQFRDHPATLAWYLNDELGLEYMDRLEAHQQWLEELDPGHPTWVVLYQVGLLGQYVRTFDVIGTDPYPIPNSPPRMAGDWARMTVDSVAGRRPVWMVPQVFNWGCYNETDKTAGRPPTLPEMRSMAWQCIAEDAKGLIFYSFFDLKRDRAVPFDTQWGLVKQVAAEVKDFAPVILSVEPAPEFAAPQRDWLHWTVRKVGTTAYLIAVNDDRVGHTVAFDLGATPRAVRLRGASEPVAATQSLRAQFEPFGVNVYEMEF